MELIFLIQTLPMDKLTPLTSWNHYGGGGGGGERGVQ